MEQTAKTSTRAIVSLILAVVALPAIAGLGWGGAIFGLAAVVVGVSARRQIAESDGMETGDGLARAGIIIGGIAMLLPLAAIVVITLLALLGPGA